MSNVSLINGHIDGADTCVICGRDIPEGSRVCVICGKTEPKDMVEVVRCKDCEYWGGITFGNICRRWTGLNVKNCTKPTDFCSYGERRGKG